MAQNYLQKGAAMSWKNDTGAEVLSGQAVLVGTVFGVASGNIPAGERGTIFVEEVWALPKITGAIAQGAALYWDADGDPLGGVAGSGALTTVSADGVAAGFAWAAAEATDTTVEIKLN